VTDRMQVIHGDCLTVLRADVLGYDYRLGYAPPATPNASVDSVVTDPPYGLSFMSKEWDSFAAKGLGSRVRQRRAAEVTPRGEAHTTSAGAYLAAGVDDTRSGGRPYQQWCEQWAAECLRVLKPGGHMLAFGGTRTSHRLACAIEDAGFEIRDSIVWVYASGFPKSLDVGKQIDKMDAVDERFARGREFQAWLREHLTPQQVNGATGTEMGHHLTTHPSQPEVATAALFDRLRPLLPEVPARIEALVAQRTVESQNFAARAVVGTITRPDARRVRPGFSGETHSGVAAGALRDVAVTVAHTDDARRWQGWGTALKPAHEPIIVARKPLASTVAQTVLAHGTGAINVDGCRVGMSETDRARIDNMGGFGRAGWSRQDGSLDDVLTGTVNGSLAPTDAQAHTDGRWPSNVVLSHAASPDGTDLCGDGCVPGCPVRELDEQSGESGSRMGGTCTRTEASGVPIAPDGGVGRGGHADTGGASRFFPVFRYEPKADAAERPRYLRRACNCETIKPWQEALPQKDTDGSRSGGDRSWSTSTSGNNDTADQSPPDMTSTISTATSSTMTLPTSALSPSSSTNASTPAVNSETASGGSPVVSVVNSSPSRLTTGTSVQKDGRSTADADRAISPELSLTSVCEECGTPYKREAHATVKPLDLMRWLVRLVTPPTTPDGKTGLILDPFAGSGTTAEAALLEGFRCIAIEREADYLPLIQQRIDRRLDPVAHHLATRTDDAPPSLFDL
jgi:DNA modification methylase